MAEKDLSIVLRQHADILTQIGGYHSYILFLEYSKQLVVGRYKTNIAKQFSGKLITILMKISLYLNIANQIYTTGIISNTWQVVLHSKLLNWKIYISLFEVTGLKRTDPNSYL